MTVEYFYFGASVFIAVKLVNNYSEKDNNKGDMNHMKTLLFLANQTINFFAIKGRLRFSVFFQPFLQPFLQEW